MPQTTTVAAGPDAGMCACTASGTTAPDVQEGPVELSPAVHGFLKALASPTRQRIMLLFARGAELSVNQVSQLAGIGQPRASEQLAELKRGGILASRKEGKVVLYWADKETIASALSNLQAYLQHCC